MLHMMFNDSYMLFILSVVFVKAIKEMKENSVILDCEGPEDIEVTWKKDNTVITGQKKSIYEVEAEKGTVGGFYSCEYKTDTNEAIKHTFYLKIKGEETSLLFSTMTLFFTHNVHHNNNNTHSLCVSVCQNCYELSGLTTWGVILGDLLFTGVVILGIYICSTRNSDSTQKKGTDNI